jgi:hypothetical protein
LDKEEEGRISFKISKMFFPIEPSLHNSFLDVSSIVEVTEIVKKEE